MRTLNKIAAPLSLRLSGFSPLPSGFCREAHTSLCVSSAMGGIVSPQNGALGSSPQDLRMWPCWERGSHRGNRSKTGSLGWAPIQCGWCPMIRGKLDTETDRQRKVVYRGWHRGEGHLHATESGLDKPPELRDNTFQSSQPPRLRCWVRAAPAN